MEGMDIWEYKTWLHRIIKEKQELEPSLTDLYLIKLAMEIRLLRYATQQYEGEVSVDPEDFLIKSETTKETTKPSSSQLKNQVDNAQSVAKWTSMLPGAQLPDINEWIKAN